MNDPNEMGARQARLEQMVQDLLAEARRQGASAAEAGVSSDAGLVVNVRMGEVETIEHTRDNGLGITVYFGTRKGSASTSDLSPQAIRDTVTAACNIARFTHADEFNGLADAELMARDLPDLDLYHPWDIDATHAIELARRCEAAAFAVDPRIDNSEGASVATHNGLHVYGNSHGFVGGYPSSRHSLSCAVVGAEGEKMRRDSWYTQGCRAEDLESPESVGAEAGRQTLARLGARRIATCETPVVFRADTAGGLLRSLIGAIRGSALYRRASFLLDHLDKDIFPSFVRIGEHPLLPRGLASSAFDAEGVATRVQDFVHDGRLVSYVLSSYSARKLGMQTTGNAGGVRNLSIATGDMDLAGLLRQMDTGLLVTEMMGQGANMVTGDYSRGASGFWVEGGEIKFPVEEITIAGNLKEMFAGLQAVGNDVDRRSSIRTGSWLVERMTVAGE